MWSRPWRISVNLPWTKQGMLLALGVVLLMNACFYLAIARLPLGTVGAIEFLTKLALDNADPLVDVLHLLLVGPATLLCERIGSVAAPINARASRMWAIPSAQSPNREQNSVYYRRVLRTSVAPPARAGAAYPSQHARIRV